MKPSLLDLTQSILSSLESDEVNSIGDTTESLQVANLIRQVYFNIIARANLTKHTELFQLDASTDPDKPVLMTVPEHISRVEWIKYFRDDDVADNSDSYQYVTILPVQQFLDLVNMLDITQDNIDEFAFTQNGNTWNFRFRTDVQPCYCTIFSNNQVVFDSFDNEVDSTLQSSKTLCFGERQITFDMSDTFIPDLDEQLFPLLLNEAKTLAFFELKQTPHTLSDRESKRQWVVAQKEKSISEIPSHFNQLPYYGRR